MANSMISQITLPNTDTYNIQNTFYGTSSTSASTAAKAVTSSNFSLGAGNMITVLFSTANTAAALTLNVNSTGAAAVYYNGAATSSSNQLIWAANEVLQFIYDGTYWVFVSKSISSGGADVEEYTDEEIASLVLETPSGITPISSAAGVNF